MNETRVGIWLIGAWGGVGTTVALGLAALRDGLTDATGLTTSLPLFARLWLPEPGSYVVGGHDVRRVSFETTCTEFQKRSNVFDSSLVAKCAETLRAWDANVRQGTLLNAGDAISRLADSSLSSGPEKPLAAINRIQADYQSF